MFDDKGNKKAYTFKKSERLSSKIEIRELFENGSSFYLYPFKVIFLPNKAPLDYHKILVSIPRRRFKLAVTRNKIKRRIREAYRLNNPADFPVNHDQIPLLIAYIYVGRDVYNYNFIEDKLRKTFDRLKSQKR